MYSVDFSWDAPLGCLGVLRRSDKAKFVPQRGHLAKPDLDRREQRQANLFGMVRRRPPFEVTPLEKCS